MQLGDQDGNEICYSFHTALFVYLEIVYNYEIHDSFVNTKPHSGPITKEKTKLKQNQNHKTIKYDFVKTLRK